MLLLYASSDSQSHYLGAVSVKCALFAIAALVCSAPVFPEGSPSRAEVVEHYCHANELMTGPEVDRVNAIEQRLGPVLRRIQGPHILVAVVESNIINAWDNNLNPRTSLICVPTAMVRFIGDSEGEIAFILAHETGHALDGACKSSTGRAAVALPTLSGEVARLLGGSGRNLLAEQRTCESRADTIGFAMFTAAGYNPFDAAGAFGRLEMYSGDVSSGIVARLAALGRTHPMTPDRIAHMRSLLIASLRESAGQ
jgi:Zn-dependent protease with chaperone function